MMNAATGTYTVLNTGVATMTLEDLLQSLRELDESMVTYFNALATKYGFSFARGDMLLLPKGHGFYIPKALAHVVKEHSVVKDALFVKAGFVIPWPFGL